MHNGIELNLDSIVGPTHNYSGLSYGNIASMTHRQIASNPKKAALQGLAKMKKLTSFGLKQAVLPPHERPFIPILRGLGFYGTDAEVVAAAWKADPSLLAACSSAAYMWAANAATVSPSADSYDKRVHFTPANLLSNFHRSFEAATTGLALFRIFNHPAYFVHHYPLPYHPDYADEGAANHTRFCHAFNQPGVQLFVFGRAGSGDPTSKFPARQTEAAARALMRLHRLTPDHVVFAQQNPEAIDAGVFHNDVISVGHQNLFFYHEKAFIGTPQVIAKLKERVETVCQVPLIALEVKNAEISLAEVVKTYLFNSQIITLPDQTMLMIAPEECEQSIPVQQYLTHLIQDSNCPIKQVIFQDLRESMQNGGGPACLRLRIALNKTEFDAMLPTVLLTDLLYQRLVVWVEKTYRDHLTPGDLADPTLLNEQHQALDELTSILELGPLYSFQQRKQPPPPPLPEKGYERI
jgi:succinylarginine dihydrolase